MSFFAPSDFSYLSPSGVTSSPDPLLLPFLNAIRRGDEAAARDSLDRLIHVHADPIISAAVYKYIHGKSSYTQHEAVDIRAETVRYLLHHLTNRSVAYSAPRNFRALVKITARHMCWKQSRKAQREAVVSSLHQSVGGTPFSLEETTADKADVSETVTHREMLHAVWEEIGDMPTMHRAALLLNIRSPDGGGGFRLLANTLGASTAEMAGLLGVSPSEMSDLLRLLPMEDSAIGKRLNVSVRDLQNFRIAARRRLHRRLSGWF